MNIRRPHSRLRRRRIVFEPEDEELLREGLDELKETGSFVCLRTRALLLLLMDGPVRTKTAVSLNAEDVVKDPEARRITVSAEVRQPPRESNKYRGLDFFITDVVRQALAGYLRVVRRDGWLPSESLKGALFLSTYHRGSGQRLTRRAAISSWESFQMAHMTERSRDYSLDDLVYTGRKKFLEAADMDSNALSEHTGLSRRSAATYVDEPSVSAREVVARLNRHKD